MLRVGWKFEADGMEYNFALFGYVTGPAPVRRVFIKFDVFGKPDDEGNAIDVRVHVDPRDIKLDVRLGGRAIEVLGGSTMDRFVEQFEKVLAR